MEVNSANYLGPGIHGHKPLPDPDSWDTIGNSTEQNSKHRFKTDWRGDKKERGRKRVQGRTVAVRLSNALQGG